MEVDRAYFKVIRWLAKKGLLCRVFDHKTKSTHTDSIYTRKGNRQVTRFIGVVEYCTRKRCTYMASVGKVCVIEEKMMDDEEWEKLA